MRHITSNVKMIIVYVVHVKVEGADYRSDHVWMMTRPFTKMMRTWHEKSDESIELMRWQLFINFSYTSDLSGLWSSLDRIFILWQTRQDNLIGGPRIVKLLKNDWYLHLHTKQTIRIALCRHVYCFMSKVSIIFLIPFLFLVFRTQNIISLHNSTVDICLWLYWRICLDTINIFWIY